jgi:hypothetical protein
VDSNFRLVVNRTSVNILTEASRHGLIQPPTLQALQSDPQAHSGVIQTWLNWQWPSTFWPSRGFRPIGARFAKAQPETALAGVTLAIYTRTGDQGETDLLRGIRVPKNAALLEVCGTLDEFNALLGLVRCERPPEGGNLQALGKGVGDAQNALIYAVWQRRRGP